MSTSPRDFAHHLITLIDKRIRRAFESYRPTAAKLDGQIPPGSLPPGGDTGSGYTPSPHDHDDRYWTKDQSDQRFAPINHTHNYLPATGGTLAGDLYITGDLVAEDIEASRVDATVLAATIGLYVAPNGTPIGGIDVDGKAYATNITTTPAPFCIPKARSDGTIDPGWIPSGSGGGGGGSLPAAHAATHASGGTDPIDPATIGAATPDDLATEIAIHAANKATTGATGHVKPDGTTITIDADGTIHAAQRMTSIEIVSTGTGVSRTWTNQPAAITELFGADHHRRYMELAGYTQARIQIRQGVGGATGATIRAQYSTNGGSTWSYLDGTAGPQVAADNTTGTTAIRAGAWSPIAAGAKVGDVLIRLVGQDSDGVADPTYGQIYLDLK